MTNRFISVGDLSSDEVIRRFNQLGIVHENIEEAMKKYGSQTLLYLDRSRYGTKYSLRNNSKQVTWEDLGYKETNMNYLKITSMDSDYFVENPVFENDKICFSKYYCDLKLKTYRDSSIYIKSVTKMEPLTKEEFDRGNPENKMVEVQLNTKYTAEVTLDGIKVGCALFPHSVVPQLQEAISKVTK